MITFQKLINDYLDSSKNMELLTREIDCFVEEVKKNNPELVEKFLVKIDLLINPNFTKETAEYAVSKMKNRDGSTGEKWSYYETSKVLNSKGFNFNPADWYYVLNMTYSDKYKQGKTSEDYIDDAYMFLDDIDAPKDKAKRYYLAMGY